MRKVETIWHHLLYQALEKKQFKLTQKEVARLFGFSLSTVNHALTIPSSIGAVRKESKFFVLADFRKLLYYWASVRNLEKDIIYKTYCETDVFEIEGLTIPDSIYACYSAARKILDEPPADYAKVYFYIEEKDLPKLRQRFSPNTLHPPNVFALKMIPLMKRYGPTTTIIQTFVDIWNLSDWYSKDFTDSLEAKINELLS